MQTKRAAYETTTPARHITPSIKRRLNSENTPPSPILDMYRLFVFGNDRSRDGANIRLRNRLLNLDIQKKT